MGVRRLLAATGQHYIYTKQDEGQTYAEFHQTEDKLLLMSDNYIELGN